MNIGLQRRALEENLRQQLQQRHGELVELISTKHKVGGVEYLEDQRLVEAVTAQQKAWNEYKKHECELIGTLSGGMSTWQSARVVECEVNLTSQRLRRMQDAVRCINKIAAELRLSERQRCLYQIAPLAVPLER